MCRYSRGGVVEAAFYIQIINAILPDAFSLLDLGRIVRFNIFSRFAQSQSFLNWCLAPPAFNLPERFANASRTIYLAILYAPILPVSPIIGAAGIAFSYSADLWLALQLSQTPRAFDSDALELVGSLLGLLPLAQSLLIYLLYFKDFQSDALPAFVIGVLMVALVFLLPVKVFFKFGRRREAEDGGTNDRRCWPAPPRLQSGATAPLGGPVCLTSTRVRAALARTWGT